MSKRRKNVRTCAPGQRVQIVGKSAQHLLQTHRVTTGFVEDCVKATIWVCLDDGHRWGAHADHVKPTRVTQKEVLSKLVNRLPNPDPDKIAGAARSYQLALRDYVDAIEDNRGIATARRKLAESGKALKRSLGPSRPLTVVASAGGAAIGASLGGPVGAAAGAVVGGATPLVMRTMRDRKQAREEEERESNEEERESNPRVRRLKNRLLR